VTGVGAVTAILAAAGRGVRLGARKQLLEFNGKPLAAWSLETFAACPLVTDIVVVCEADEHEAFIDLSRDRGGGKVRAVVSGGERRQDSVYAGLRAAPAATSIAIVHDGARPFVTREQIEAVLAAARESGAAILAVPEKETVKQAGEGGSVARTLPREALWHAQTPQAFEFGILMRAYAAAEQGGFVGTDCSMLVEAAGETAVRIVEGSYDNLKITTSEDLIIATHLAQARSSAI
jgi:2-C-methyl-D-erythritol 4-phosphate cytidylyltransferase